MKEKRKLTSPISKLSITIFQALKEWFGSVDKRFLGIQHINLGTSSKQISKSCGPTLKYLYIQTYKSQQQHK